MTDRKDVRRRWRAMADGTLGREDVHDWAESLMLGEPFSDPMVAEAPQYMHGFSLSDRSGDHLGLKEEPETYLDALAAGNSRPRAEGPLPPFGR